MARFGGELFQLPWAVVGMFNGDAMSLEVEAGAAETAAEKTRTMGAMYFILTDLYRTVAERKGR